MENKSNASKTSINDSIDLESRIETIISSKLAILNSIKEENQADLRFLRISVKKLDRESMLMEKCKNELNQLTMAMKSGKKKGPVKYAQSHIFGGLSRRNINVKEKRRGSLMGRDVKGGEERGRLRTRTMVPSLKLKKGETFDISSGEEGSDKQAAKEAGQREAGEKQATDRKERAREDRGKKRENEAERKKRWEEMKRSRQEKIEEKREKERERKEGEEGRRRLREERRREREQQRREREQRREERRESRQMIKMKLMKSKNKKEEKKKGKKPGSERRLKAAIPRFNWLKSKKKGRAKREEKNGKKEEDITSRVVAELKKKSGMGEEKTEPKEVKEAPGEEAKAEASQMLEKVDEEAGEGSVEREREGTEQTLGAEGPETREEEQKDPKEVKKEVKKTESSEDGEKKQAKEQPDTTKRTRRLAEQAKPANRDKKAEDTESPKINIISANKTEKNKKTKNLEKAKLTAEKSSDNLLKCPFEVDKKRRLINRPKISKCLSIEEIAEKKILACMVRYNPSISFQIFRRSGYVHDLIQSQIHELNQNLKELVLQRKTIAKKNSDILTEIEELQEELVEYKPQVLESTEDFLNLLTIDMLDDFEEDVRGGCAQRAQFYRVFLNICVDHRDFRLPADQFFWEAVTEYLREYSEYFMDISPRDLHVKQILELDKFLRRNPKLFENWYQVQDDCELTYYLGLFIFEMLKELGLGVHVPNVGIEESEEDRARDFARRLNWLHCKQQIFENQKNALEKSILHFN